MNRDDATVDGFGDEWRRFDQRALDDLPHHDLLTPAMIADLHPIDRRSYEAGLLGSNPNGLYKPPPR